MRHAGAGGGHGGAHPAGRSDVVVLDQNAVVQTVAVIEPAADTHRVFLQDIWYHSPTNGRNHGLPSYGAGTTGKPIRPAASAASEPVAEVRMAAAYALGDVGAQLRSEAQLSPVKYFFKEMFDKEITEIETLEEKEQELSAELEQEPEDESEEEGEEPHDKALRREIKGLKAELRDCKKALSAKKGRINNIESMLGQKENELDAITSRQSSLKEIKREIKEKNGQLVEKVKGTIGIFDETDAEKMVLRKIENVSLQCLNVYLTAQKNRIIAYFENLWDKYGANLRTMENVRDNVLKELNNHLRELGYDK